MKPNILALLVLIISWTAVTSAQEQVVIEAFESSGQIQFSKVSNAVSYRVEWAPGADGPWTNFATASSALDLIPAEGFGAVTASVPMLYRVVATVMNPPSTPIGMSLIPAGEFVMGDDFSEGDSDERPLRTNYISGFYMDQYEVTKALWDEVRTWALTNGYTFGTEFGGKAADHPVHSVDWYDAIAWCNARSEREELTPCYTNASGTIYKTASDDGFGGGCNWTASGYRLPTEAEWEKAARGGVAKQRFPWGNTISHGDANYHANPSGYSDDVNPTSGYHPTFTNGIPPYTSPAGYFEPNGYVLYDMSGNVWEWCWDWYSTSYYSSSPSTDPQGPSYGDFGTPVLRGGSWVNGAGNARVANRYDNYPDLERSDIGFRCARGL